MAKIISDLKVYGDKESLQLSVLFDSGAGLSLIRGDIANKLVQHFVTLKEKLVLFGFNSKSGEEVKKTCTLQIQMKNEK